MQVLSFYFKAKKRGVAPVYSSVSQDESKERAALQELTLSRRLRRAEQAKEDERDMFATTLEEEVFILLLFLPPPLRFPFLSL